MNWNQLFTTQRLHESKEKSKDARKIRTSFVRDFDRIVFSAPFRKLQNKTQVFPLPGVEFVHNRLTHSLEVASVGRSIGKTVGAQIAANSTQEEADFKDFYEHELSNVIAAACLAHDIGNPPFGHSGEDAIRNYFINLKGDAQRILQQSLSKEELADFERFEGNSNALRLLTHSFSQNDSVFNLTLTTLASIIKYPTASFQGFLKNSGVASKKAGYFQADKDAFLKIMEAFQLPQLQNGAYARHPFVYLTEAADDICYRIIDIEDAERLGIITLDEVQALFLPFFEEEQGYNNIKMVQQNLEAIKGASQKVQYIRARWIGLMVDKCAAAFMNNEDAILAGTYNTSLLEDIHPRFTTLIKNVNIFSLEKIYKHKNVVEVELAGFNVIGTLLEAFIEALVYENNLKSEKLLQLIDPLYTIDRNNQSLYQNILSIVDFISGMTDNFAIDLYRKIKGIEIAGLARY